MINILAILPISIGGRLTTSSIIDGMRLNSCNVIVYDELFEDKQVLTDIFNSQKYDYLLSYDFTAIHHNLENNFKLKTINYFSDLIEGSASTTSHHKYIPEMQTSNNYNFYWDKCDTKRLQENFKHLYYLPHFVNTNIYYDFGYQRPVDIMFAGRLDTQLRLNNILHICKSFNNYKISWYAIKRHYDDAISRCDKNDAKYIENIYKGFIDNEQDMAQELNKAKIVINFHSQGKSAVNYRTFQSMACGCCVLSDMQNEIPELFETDKEIICYDNINEMTEKLKFLLDNQTLQTAISKNAQSCIKNKYNAQLGCQKILKIINEN